VSAIFGPIPHAAAVHIPLALAVLFPGFYWSALWSTNRRLMPDRIWFAIWILSTVQVLTIVVALITGEQAEFLSAGSQTEMERHEHFAYGFLALWIVVFAALCASMWKTKLRTLEFHFALSAILVAQFVLALFIGHIGGSLLR
jgi:hypothetical protein